MKTTSTALLPVARAALLGGICLIPLLLACTGPPGPPGPPGPQGISALVSNGSLDFQPTFSAVTVAEAVRPGLVCVMQRGDTREDFEGCMTGFYIDERGTVLTAAHTVIDRSDPTPPQEIAIVDAGGDQHAYEVLRQIPHHDAILLKPLGVRAVTPLPRVQETPPVGAPLVYMGFIDTDTIEDPLVVTGTLAGSARLGVTDGVRWSAPARRNATVEDGGVLYHLLVLWTSHGGSGGPVMTLDGRVMAMVTHGSPDTDNISMALDMVELEDRINGGGAE